MFTKFIKWVSLISSPCALNRKNAFNIVGNSGLIWSKFGPIWPNEFASEMASSAPMAVESIRATVRGNLADQVEEIVALELSEQIRLQSSDDFKEGIAASLERREANFNRS